MKERINLPLFYVEGARMNAHTIRASMITFLWPSRQPLGTGVLENNYITLQEVMLTTIVALPPQVTCFICMYMDRCIYIILLL